MASYSNLHTQDFGSDNWCLGLQPFYNHHLLTSLSNGEVHHIDWVTGKSVRVDQAGNSSINKLKIIDSNFNEGSSYAVASNNSVNILDVRSRDKLASLKNDKNAPFLSLDSRHGMLACGTELSGVDAELHIYDVRNWSTPIRSFVDSHHDDVTDIRFHPSDRNVLLSGSTDGYTNVYDLKQQEEDDALHQVINYASIHSCGWLSPKRIFTLSHMETLAMHELNDKSDELREPQPLDFGDIREKWGCSYVVDLYPGYVAVGSSQERSSFLKLMALENEQIETEKSLVIPSAHGEEVVRDVLIPPQNCNMLYSCGEDGTVKIWKTKDTGFHIEPGFWDYSKKMDVFSEEATTPEAIPAALGNGVVYEQEVEPPKKKEKKKGKQKSHAKSRRYKPY